MQSVREHLDTPRCKSRAFVRAACLSAALAGLAMGATGCYASHDRYAALPSDDRIAYERCAKQRCGPAPQWKGEALWATRQFEHEQAAHTACWDALVADFVDLPDGASRRAWLTSRCSRQSPIEFRLPGQLRPSP